MKKCMNIEEYLTRAVSMQKYYVHAQGVKILEEKYLLDSVEIRVDHYLSCFIKMILEVGMSIQQL